MIGGVEGYDTPACGGARPRARSIARGDVARETGARERARPNG